MRCRGFEEKLFSVEGEQVNRCREGQGDLETSTRGSIPLNVIQEVVDSASLLTPGTGKEKLEAERFPATRWSDSREQRSSGRDQGSSGRGHESSGRSELLTRDDASYFADGQLEEVGDTVGDTDEQGKRNVGMLRMGKRPVGILRMGRGDDSEGMVQEGNDLGQKWADQGSEEPATDDEDDDDLGRRAVGMLRMGKRPVELLRMGKRPVGLLRMGKRPVNLLRMGKRPVDLLRMGKRPVNLLRMGKRPVDLLRMG